jgi:hypothetical protein
MVFAHQQPAVLVIPGDADDAASGVVHEASPACICRAAMFCFVDLVDDQALGLDKASFTYARPLKMSWPARVMSIVSSTLW